MKYGVIDIGSNSVRLLISENGITLKKSLNTTRLAEDKKDGFLSEKPSLRTLNAVLCFVDEAKAERVDKIYIFATAAVRNAVNGKSFALALEKACGIKVDIVPGETEAVLGYKGALKDKDGAVLDIGGGSTEVAVVKDGKCVYAKSLPIGAVVLTDKFGQDSVAVRNFVKNQVAFYGVIPNADFYCIGGTCTSLAAVSLKLAVYDAERVDGYKLTRDEISRLANAISALSVEDRKGLAGLQKERADIIHAGAIILDEIAKYTGVDYFTVSDSDNLEGYLRYVTERK
ncbi:MAG: rod shape-determining protein [Clostridia bacterium]|nr:rod shape-determining protein [Clostridia bacterium]